ncbi:hypothetical protein [Capillimicrobium parvum]|uniref:Uncharacterized protein n=1 Tax=Capillimicrobium parvum TaxID=2884022 RepID=A0A9E6XWA8_9ACTN|nr:hypothetical protein [Capillimicrobium parvum]UGS35615.1 hypothetical protein DSM104329_02008 [Capillimicrobium parvum]
MADQEPEPPQPPTEEDRRRAERLERWFDIRRIIGGLFVLYGVILLVAGIVGTDIVKNKADGININLWTGLAMLVFGVLMWVWAVVRPLERVAGEAPSEQPSP